MPEWLAQGLVAGVGFYALLGVVFAAAFHWRGLAAVDSGAAAHGTRGFRVVITPGVVALWPLLLVRWRAAAGARA